MKVPLFVFLVLCVILTSISSYNFAYAFFSNSGQSITNTFQAASQFPTATPSPSPTSTPTSTPTPTISITPTATPTPVVANHVVISEVQITAGPGQTNQDFIELYNPTNSSIDLNGYRLVKRSGNASNDTNIKSWTSATIIQSHGFYLWASSSDSSFPSSIGADTFTSPTLADDNSIALRQGAIDIGTLIDVLSWNDGSTLAEGDEFDPDPGANQSMERKALPTSTATTMAIGGADELKGNGFDANNNATDFVLRLLSQPQNSSSPTETP